MSKIVRIFVFLALCAAGGCDDDTGYSDCNSTECWENCVLWGFNGGYCNQGVCQCEDDEDDGGCLCPSGEFYCEWGLSSGDCPYSITEAVNAEMCGLNIYAPLTCGAQQVLEDATIEGCDYNIETYWECDENGHTRGDMFLEISCDDGFNCLQQFPMYF